MTSPHSQTASSFRKNIDETCVDCVPRTPAGVRFSTEPITRSGSLALAHSGLPSFHASGVENAQPGGLRGRISRGGAQRHPR
jgi:hypothetical protein